MFSKLLLQPVDFFDAEEVGALTSRLASDCQAVARALSGNFNVAWRNALQCIGARSCMCWLMSPVWRAYGVLPEDCKML